jgi:dihydrofolate reductase
MGTSPGGPGKGLGGKDVMGGAEVIRQALAAGLVDELTIIIAPVVLGGGKATVRGLLELA